LKHEALAKCCKTGRIPDNDCREYRVSITGKVYIFSYIPLSQLCISGNEHEKNCVSFGAGSGSTIGCQIEKCQKYRMIEPVIYYVYGTETSPQIQISSNNGNKSAFNAIPANNSRPRAIDLISCSRISVLKCRRCSKCNCEMSNLFNSYGRVINQKL
jgi:hypothetical protein